MAKKAAKRAVKKSAVKTTRVWVSRDEHINADGRTYDIHERKPTRDGYGRFWADDSGLIEGCMCPKWFQRMTGIRLKPGRCRQFDLRIEAIPVTS